MNLCNSSLSLNMESRKRSRDQSPEEISYQQVTATNSIGAEFDDKTLIENSAAKTLDLNAITGNDITQTEAHVSYRHALVEAKSSNYANGTGTVKPVLSHCPPAIVSAARFAAREKYFLLQHAESCDKAIISVFGVSG